MEHAGEPRDVLVLLANRDAMQALLRVSEISPFVPTGMRLQSAFRRGRGLETGVTRLADAPLKSGPEPRTAQRPKIPGREAPLYAGRHAGRQRRASDRLRLHITYHSEE